MAWDVRGNGNTVIRLGVGLIHETWTLETFEGQFNMQGDGSTAINAIPTAATISCGITAFVPSITLPILREAEQTLSVRSVILLTNCVGILRSSSTARVHRLAGQSDRPPGRHGRPEVRRRRSWKSISMRPHVCEPESQAALCHHLQFGRDPRLRIQPLSRGRVRWQSRVQALEFHGHQSSPTGSAQCLNPVDAGAGRTDACGSQCGNGRRVGNAGIASVLLQVPLLGIHLPDREPGLFQLQQLASES